MDLMDFGTVQEGKMRLVQEMVPGKQVTLAHIIASPDEIIYQKLGLNPNVDYQQAAIGILSMTPSEISVIAGDIATKTSKVEMGFIDRFSGTLHFYRTHFKRTGRSVQYPDLSEESPGVYHL